jgi:hypothetical protein
VDLLVRADFDRSRFSELEPDRAYRWTVSVIEQDAAALLRDVEHMGLEGALACPGPSGHKCFIITATLSQLENLYIRHFIDEFSLRRERVIVGA